MTAWIDILTLDSMKFTSPSWLDVLSGIELLTGFGWDRMTFFSVAVIVLCFGYEMRIVLLAHWCLGFLLNHAYPKSRNFSCVMLCHWGGGQKKLGRSTAETGD